MGRGMRTAAKCYFCFVCCNGACGRRTPSREKSATGRGKRNGERRQPRSRPVVRDADADRSRGGYRRRALFEPCAGPARCGRRRHCTVWDDRRRAVVFGDRAARGTQSAALRRPRAAAVDGGHGLRFGGGCARAHPARARQRRVTLPDRAALLLQGTPGRCRIRLFMPD